MQRLLTLNHCLLVLAMAGCQHLPQPSLSQTDTSNVSWEDVAVKRSKLSTSLDLAPDDRKPDEKSESEQSNDAQGQVNKIVTAVIPEINLPLLALSPKSLDPDMFLGRSTNDLQGRLGAPSTVRTDGATRIWQYQFSNCVVDFFFYENAGRVIATYTDMRSTFLGGHLEPDSCMQALYEVSKKSGGSP